ncbi:hypothetical protein [Trueperella pyogenes]|uniref:hypothetical protein n=1 Tax=Trueperella pyogenes TaxID=1661 RepID=UPI00345DBA8F
MYLATSVMLAILLPSLQQPGSRFTTMIHMGTRGQSESETGISRAQAKKLSTRIRNGNMHPDDLQLIQRWRKQCVPLTRDCFALVAECADEISDAVVTYRMKRVPSIKGKIERPNASFNLHTMDDIGGCRLIVKNIEDVPPALSMLQAKLENSSMGKPEMSVKNYIDSPKESGYRSCHLIIRFPDIPGANRIEIQIRTELQHHWATAVEVFDEIYGSSIKSPRGNENDESIIADCKSLLQIASGLFAFEENKPRIPGMNESKSELLEKLTRIERLDEITRQLEAACQDVVVQPSTTIEDGEIHILRFFKDHQLLIVDHFSQQELQHALEQYELFEQHAFSPEPGDDIEPENVNVVLVRAKSMNLQVAYPNYSAQTLVFLERLKHYRKEARGSSHSP